jgi:hypothetical protein
VTGSAGRQPGRAVAAALAAVVAGAVLQPVVPARHVAAQERRVPEGLITGRVIDQADGEPVAGAEVVLDDGTLRGITDDDGAFRLEGVPGGPHLLRTRRLGYGSRTDSLHVPARALLDVTVALSVEAIELDALVVTVRSPVLAGHGFYARQEQGFGGHFIDRAEIEERRPNSVTDLFRDIPGLRVIYGGIYGGRIFVNQRATFADDGRPGCEPGVWLDGIRSTMNSYDLMRAEEIEGIEVYTGGRAPGKFIDICGTVVIWTRVPIG